ncbi:MAG TPA: hypothetical protein VII58_01720 [Acidobacteriaceae bacterium]
MKITIEIPDSILLRAKAVAARRGITLQAFLIEAVQEKLARDAQK